MSVVPMTDKWNMPTEDREAVRAIAAELRVPGLVAQVANARGLRTAEDVQGFLEDARAPLSDPTDLTDMQVAVDRLHRAREASEHIRVFGDYDVDGMAATAILTRGLRRAGAEHVSYAMPDRLADGYGLSPTGVQAAARDGVDVLVTVDNGIGAHEAAAAARAANIDLIVTDHHQIEAGLPDALAVINPKRDDPEHPFSDACGSAVAFKLAWALTGEPADFDLAGVATVADVVPLRRENRQLVLRGMEELAEGTHLGLSALARKAGIQPREIRAENVAFQLAPRINASGRLGSGMTGLKLFFSESEEEADILAARLDETNLERRQIEQEIYDQALPQVEAAVERDQRSLVIAGSGWHPGVIGIVAARLQNTFWRPVVMIALDDEGVGRSSCRSTPDFDIVAALGACDQYLTRYGGHKAAAGMSLRAEDLDAFAAAFEAETARVLPAGIRERALNIDAIASFSEIDSDLLHALDRLEPFGHENPAPLFASYGVSVVRGSVRELRGGHLKCTVKHGGRAFGAIGFNLAPRYAACGSPEEVDVAYRPKFNTWRGETTVQLELKDLKPA